MRKNMLLTIIVTFSFFLTSCETKEKNKTHKKYLVMVSLDGFRWDYTQHTDTPILDSIEKQGVKAQSLKPSFPTKTFPNHYTMATGLYPDHHGIVQNSFFDPNTHREYHISNRDAVEDPYFYGGEPIWVTAEKSGLKSASFFWVGSEAPIKGMYPTYYKSYDHDFPFEQRIDTVIYWLGLPEALRPHLVLLYFHEPDGVGHAFGPEGQETYSMVHYLDSLMGILCDQLNQLPIADQINLIITSDHGMGPVDSSKTVFLDNYIDTSWFEKIMGHNPNYLLKAKDGYSDSAYQVLSIIPNVQAWKHNEVPNKLHYGTHLRTLEFVVVADPGWSVSLTGYPIHYKGAHGYDNDHRSMHAIFYAIGPAFKKNYQSPTFSNIDLYPLITEILNLSPAEVDGSLEVVKEMLKK